MPTFTFTDAETNEIYVALLDRKAETDRYLRGYRPEEPADPECCAPCRGEWARQRDRAETDRLLRQRLDAVVSATNTIRPTEDVQPTV